MGLDMYLFKTGRVDGWTDDDYRDLHSRRLRMKEIDTLPEPVRRFAKPYDFFPEDLQVFNQAAYWRKFNALHGWFVRHIQDGVDACQLGRSVTKEDFEQLKYDLENGNMEPAEGFFFGRSEKDEWYWEDIKQAKQWVTVLLKTARWDNEVYFYWSSW